MSETRFAATALLTLLGGIALAMFLSFSLFLPSQRNDDARVEPDRDNTKSHAGTVSASPRSKEAP